VLVALWLGPSPQSGSWLGWVWSCCVVTHTLPQVGSFFMINLCLVVIATQFSETKQRENQLMREQRARYLSNDSTLASFSEPGSCYEELLKYVGHIFRKVKRRSLRLYARWQSRWRKKVDPSSTLHGQGPRRRPRRAGRRTASVHHLVYHHHHHHHHHYHFSHGGPRRPSPEPGAGDTRLVRACVPPSPPSPGHGPPDSESVHSIYHADCHVEGPQERARVAHTIATAASLKLASGLGTMNYPTILPSGAVNSKGSTSSRPKGLRSAGTPGATAHSPLSLGSPSPYEKIQHVVGEQGEDPAPTMSERAGRGYPGKAWSLVLSVLGPHPHCSSLTPKGTARPFLCICLSLKNCPFLYGEAKIGVVQEGKWRPEAQGPGLRATVT
jgi:hypothetical protein